MPTDDRDNLFERALARHLPHSSPQGACPDAETLAAFHERTLSLEEIAHWQEHISACSRCQECLALVEQFQGVHPEQWEAAKVLAPSEEVARSRKMPAPAIPPRQEEPSFPSPEAAMSSPIDGKSSRARWRWVVPVGALAAGLIAFIGVREIRLQQARQKITVETAHNQPAAPPLPSAIARDKREQAKLEPPADQLKAQAGAANSIPVSVQRVAPTKNTPARVAPAGPSMAQSEATISKEKDLTGLAVGGVATSKTSEAAVQTEQARNDAQTLPPAPALSAPAAVAANRYRQELKKSPGPAPAQVAQGGQSQATPANPAASDQAFTARRDINLLHYSASDRRFIATPEATRTWRLGNGGIIEHSADGGKSWQLQASGVTADLTAGSATSDKVCWVVGKFGTILLTTDGGKHWKPVSSPIPEDLGGIHATDASHASIWDVPNRRSYRTSDGGLTWTRIADE